MGTTFVAASAASTTTPLWVPLVVAGIGVLAAVVGTVSGVVITQRGADRREREAWARQRDSVAAQWVREDESRTFEHRRQAYSDFYESLQSTARRVYTHGRGTGDEESDADGRLPDGWQLPTFRALQQVEMYGTPTVSAVADKAYVALWRWGDNTHWAQVDEAFSSAEAQFKMLVEARLLRAIREDLGIPEG